MTTALTVLVWVLAITLGLPLVFWLIFFGIAAVAAALDARTPKGRPSKNVNTRR